MTGGPVDPTTPLPPEPGRRGAPDSTQAIPEALPGAYDPTIAVPPVVPPPPGGPTGPGGPGGPGGGPVGPAPGGGRNQMVWWIVAGVAVVAIGVVIALLVAGGGKDSKPSSTSTSVSSSSTSSSTSSTTVTTTANGPQITAYNATPNPATCPNTFATVQLTLAWSTTNALGVTISIDGPGKFGDFGANGTAQVPFACSGSHTYSITANGSSGQSAQKTITVSPQLPAPTTTTAPPPASTTTTTKP